MAQVADQIVERTMTAAVLRGMEDLRIEHVAMPVADPGELVLRVGAALTCGTDLKVYRRGYHAKMLTLDRLFGHELAGTVEVQFLSWRSMLRRDEDLISGPIWAAEHVRRHPIASTSAARPGTITLTTGTRSAGCRWNRSRAIRRRRVPGPM